MHSSTEHKQNRKKSHINKIENFSSDAENNFENNFEILSACRRSTKLKNWIETSQKAKELKWFGISHVESICCQQQPRWSDMETEGKKYRLTDKCLSLYELAATEGRKTKNKCVEWTVLCCFDKAHKFTCLRASENVHVNGIDNVARAMEAN